MKTVQLAMNKCITTYIVANKAHWKLLREKIFVNVKGQAKIAYSQSTEHYGSLRV